MPYEPRIVPPSLEEELAAFLDEEFRSIASSLVAVENVLLPVLHVEPVRPRNGQIILVDGTDFNPGSGAGFYGRSAGAWVLLG